MVLRMKKDANENVHPASISVVFAPEGAVSIQAVCKAEKALLGNDSFLERAHTVQDGGTALQVERNKVFPKVVLPYAR